MTVMKRWEQSRQGKAHDVTVTQARPTGYGPGARPQSAKEQRTPVRPTSASSERGTPVRPQSAGARRPLSAASARNLGTPARTTSTAFGGGVGDRPPNGMGMAGFAPRSRPLA